MNSNSCARAECIALTCIAIAALAATACVPLSDVAQTADGAAGAVQGAIQNNNGATTPADATGTVLEIATWVLAALGLGPLSRVIMAAKPAVVGVVDLIVGKRKSAEKPTATS